MYTMMINTKKKIKPINARHVSIECLWYCTYERKKLMFLLYINIFLFLSCYSIFVILLFACLQGLIFAKGIETWSSVVECVACMARDHQCICSISLVNDVRT